MLVPPSRSDATSSGRLERRCSRFSLAAMSSGEPTETMTPADMQRIHPRLRPREAIVVEGGVGAGNPGHHELRDAVAD